MSNAQSWIFSIRFCSEGQPDLRRRAIVGPARASTIEAALHLAEVPEAVRVDIRSSALARNFVDGRLDPDKGGYYHQADDQASWTICVGSVHAVLGESR